MARLARAVAPGAPHHVLQRGNRGQRVFSSDDDYKDYIALLAEGCASANVVVLAYCLLPTRVHLILLPRDRDGLRAALGEAHRRFTRAANVRRSRGGGLFRGRFASFPMDLDALPACTRYVEQAATRARLVERARDWRWSSAQAHLKGRNDVLVDVKHLLAIVEDWRSELSQGLTAIELKAIAACERTGRPYGSVAFVKKLEKRLGRTLARQRPGPKPKRNGRPKRTAV